MKRTFFLILSLVMAIAMASAQSYVVIDKAGKVFDEANSKYVTLNQANNEVSVTPGMAFKTMEKTPGWVMIEYSPGLRAFIQENILTFEPKAPAPGTYKVKNNPSQEVTVQKEGDNWKAVSGGKEYPGKNYDNVIIFLDDLNNQAFSLADPGTGPVVMTYDNKVTKFF